MTTTFERMTSKHDTMTGRGTAHRLKPGVIVSPIDEVQEEELNGAKSELLLLGTNLRTAMLSSGIAEFSLDAVLRYLLVDVARVFIRRVSKSFLERTRKPLTEDAVVRIVTTHAIMCSYPVSAEEYFSMRDADPPMFLYLDKMCSPDEYAAFFSLLERVDVPAGASFAPVYAESLLLTETLRAIVATNSSLLGVPAGVSGGVQVIIDDHQLPGRSKSMSSSGYKPKSNDKKRSTLGPSFDALSTRHAGFVVGLSLSRKCDSASGSGGEDGHAHLDFFGDVLRHSGRKDFRGCTLFFDRGYDLEPVARKLRFDFLATSKKGYNANPDVPVTYELPANTSAANRAWMLDVSLTGPTEVIWVERENSRGHTYYMAYRPPGKSLVVIMCTNQASLVNRFVIPDAGVVDDEVEDDYELEEEEVAAAGEGEDDSPSDEARSDGEAGDVPTTSSLPHLLPPPQLEPFVALSGAQRALVEEARMRDLAGTEVLVPSQGRQRVLWITSRPGTISSTGVETVVRCHAQHRLAAELSGVAPEVLLCEELRCEGISLFDRGIQDDTVRDATKKKWAEVMAQLAAAKTEARKRAVLKAAVEPHREYVEQLSELVHMRTDLSKALDAVKGVSLEGASEAQLRAAAKELKVKDHEKMKEVSALREAVKGARLARVGELQKPLVEAMMDPWGARPFATSEAMTVGSLGEEVIRPASRGILLSLGKRLEQAETTHKLHFVSEVEEEGMRASRASGYCVTSLDGVLAHGTVSRPKKASDLNASFVEYKMLSGAKPLEEVRGIVATRGEYDEVHFKLGASQVERDEIYGMFGSHRSGDMLQLIHHLAVSGLAGYYVLSDARVGEVLRVVRVTMDPAMRERHLATLHLIGSYFFPRTFNREAKMKAAAGLTEDQLEFLFRRRDAVVNGKVSRTAKPLIPRAVYLWNRSKSAVDAMSRTVHNMRVPTSRPGTHRKLIVEILNVLIHNAVRLTHVLRVLPDLDAFASVEELARELRGKVSVGQFIRLQFTEASARGREDVTPRTPTRSGSSGAAQRRASSSSGCDPFNEEWKARVATARAELKGSAMRAEAWNTEVLGQLRLNSVSGSWLVHNHERVPETRQCCAICCQRCGNDDAPGGKHACTGRRGHLTSTRCSTCLEFLCMRPRPNLWGPGRTCWEVFHHEEELPLHPYLDYTAPTGSAVKRARLDPGAETYGSAAKRGRTLALPKQSGSRGKKYFASPSAVGVTNVMACGRVVPYTKSAVSKRVAGKGGQEARHKGVVRQLSMNEDT